MKTYLLAHDLGTSGNKATLYTEEGVLVAACVHTYKTFYPHHQWVEQNPEDWWRAICATTKELLETSGVAPAAIACVSFSAQMMGCLLIDKEGNALRNMITWADSRSGKQEKWMVQQAGGLQRAYQITGHRLSASYSAAKLLWVKENEPDNYRRAFKMIHAKDFIIARLTGNIVTDYSDASGTNLLDITRKEWSDDLIGAFGIRKDLLPELHPSTDIAGTVTKAAASECGLLEGTPVVIGGGDGSCAAAGAGALQEGKAYNVIGTSSWISTASTTPVFDDEMRVFNWVHLDETLYTPCGTMQAAGLSYQWYKNTLCTGEAAKAETLGQSIYTLLDEAARNAPVGANGLLYLPYLIGERSPRWNLDASGCFIGLTASTTKGEINRSILEGVGMNLRVILEVLEKQQNLPEITMIGGGAKGKVWLQILADIWQKPLLIPAYMEEATSMGAAICGGVGVGLYGSFADCAGFNPVRETVLPNVGNAEVYNSLYPIFNKAYQQLVPVYEALATHKQAHKKGGTL